MNNFDLTREDVLAKAVKDCYREMFAKAQPTADWDCLIAEYKAGKIDEKNDGPIYDRHYLSHEEYKYIIDKYIDAYRIAPEFKEDIDILKSYLLKGGSKDKYIESYTDKYGNYHPGTRGYEKVKPLKKHIYDIIYGEYDGNGEIAKGVTDKVLNKVIELINACQDFYSFNIDEQKFINTLTMGATPTPNAETVKKWWKDHYNVDIEIEERNPLLLWEMDYYGDNFEEVMEEEYGNNWKDQWNKKWEDQKAQKKAEYEALLKKIEENAGNNK